MIYWTFRAISSITSVDIPILETPHRRTEDTLISFKLDNFDINLKHTSDNPLGCKSIQNIECKVKLCVNELIMKQRYCFD